MSDSPPGTKECPHCGTWVQSGFTHCSKCGQKMKEDKRGNWLVIAIGVIAALWLCNTLLGSSGGSSPSTFSPPDDEQSRFVNVEYRVDGTANSVDLTIENSSGNTEQRDNVALPYRQSFNVERGAFVYLSAQNNGERGTVECEIRVNGVPIETAESEGAYVIASCSGSAE